MASSSEKKKLARRFAVAIAGGSLLPLSPAFAIDLGESVNSVRAEQGEHIMNLRDVDISVLIDDVSAMTGYTFIVHPSVRGQVTVSSQTPLTTEEVFQVFMSTLRVHGYTAIPAQGGMYKIVPEQAASSEAALAQRSVSGDQFETAVLSLRNFSAVEAAKMIKPITNAQGQLTTSSRSNSLIVVDYATNIARVRKVIAELDRDKSSVISLQLQNMSATEMATILNSLASGEKGFSFDINAISVDSNNSVVLRGDDEDVARVLEIARSLDAQGRAPEETLKVISLRHSEAKDLSPILEALGKTMAASATPAGGKRSEPTIAIYEPTNSIIINADPIILRQLERVVSELDVRRSQVLVEAVIVELSDSTARELGVQLILGDANNPSIPFAATNFSRSTPNLLTLAGALATGDVTVSDTGSNLTTQAVASLLGANGALFGVGASNSDGTIFGAIVNAVEDDVDSNILSTPSVLTLDNETASIIVGQEIPITTGQSLGSDNVNPFRTVEREEIGVVLEVQPQIGEGESIKLNLRQEVSSIFGAALEGTDIITNKREIKTTVLADDGEIIVLGGLIQEDEALTVSKVPLLGDIPFFGRVFRSEGRSISRRNLMVFLRPTIVRDAEKMRQTTAQKYGYIRDTELETTGDDEARLDTFIRDVLGVQD